MFITGIPRPTYEEIAQQCGIPEGSIRRVSAQQCWVDLRSARQEQKLLEADASAIIAKTCKEVHAAPGILADAVIELATRIVATMRLLDGENRPARHTADVLNTLSFAGLNAANTLDKLGIAGFDSILKKNGREAGGVDGHGKWDKQLLQQINVTVQGLAATIPQADAKSEPVATDGPP